MFPHVAMSSLMFCGSRHKLEDLRLVFLLLFGLFSAFGLLFVSLFFFVFQFSVALLSFKVISQSAVASCFK